MLLDVCELAMLSFTTNFVDNKNILWCYQDLFRLVINADWGVVKIKLILILCMNMTACSNLLELAGDMLKTRMLIPTFINTAHTL